MIQTRKKNIKNKSKKISKSKKIFTKKDFLIGDGMITSVWGPAMWHYLHTISFNYPVNPCKETKFYYKQLIYNLKQTLPCKYCRINLKKTLKISPLNECHLINRDKFSRYIYRLHEIINKQLGKKSGLSYCEVRERYEHFRARCTRENKKIFKFKKTTKKEKGCTEPLYGKKAKCIIKIIPTSSKCKTIQIDKSCLKSK